MPIVTILSCITPDLYYPSIVSIYTTLPLYQIYITTALYQILFIISCMCRMCSLSIPIGKTNPGGVHDGRLVSTMILFPRSLPSSGRRASRIAKTLLFRDMPAKKMQARILYLQACLWYQGARRRIYILYILYVRCSLYAGAEDAQEQEDSDPISGSCAPTV